MLCLHPKSALCSCQDCILDITSFGSADSVCRVSNNGVGQFKPILQVEGNTCHPIFLLISQLIECSIQWLLRLDLDFETLCAEICRSRRFSKGVGGSLSANICHKTRVITVMCIEISAVHYLVLSRYTCLTDR